MHVTYTRDGYRISTDPALLDVDVVHRQLQQGYWAPGIPREVVARSIANSLCFGLYVEAGASQGEPHGSPAGAPGVAQIGVARVVTDRATFAYLTDVFVDPAQRGRGLSKWLMDCIMAHPDLQGLRRWSLSTADAQELYRRYGFKPLAAPEIWMEIYDGRVHSKKAQGG